MLSSSRFIEAECFDHWCKPEIAALVWGRPWGYILGVWAGYNMLRELNASPTDSDSLRLKIIFCLHFVDVSSLSAKHNSQSFIWYRNRYQLGPSNSTLVHAQGEISLLNNYIYSREKYIYIYLSILYVYSVLDATVGFRIESPFDLIDI